MWQVNDLREARIEEELEKLSKMMLVYIHPSNLNHTEYLRRNIYFQKKMTSRVQVNVFVYSVRRKINNSFRIRRLSKF